MIKNDICYEYSINSGAIYIIKKIDFIYTYII